MDEWLFRVWVCGVSLAMAVLGCGSAGGGASGSGGGGEAGAGGTSGAGGSSASSSSSGGAGGSAPVVVTLDLAEPKGCGSHFPAFPINGDPGYVDESGLPIFEDGAMMVRCSSFKHPVTVVGYDVAVTKFSDFCVDNPPISTFWFTAPTPAADGKLTVERGPKVVPHE